MEWTEVIIDTATLGLETVCAQLAMLGIDSLSIQDEREFQSILEQLEPAWELVDPALRDRMQGACRVIFYLPPADLKTLNAVKEMLFSLPDDRATFGTLDLRVNRLREEEWAENWKQYYKPVPIGKRLLVQPAWEPRAPAENRTVFINNPGMSFGTGEHETTRLCLEEIDRLVAGGEHILDVGCGSGILSVCALLLGAADADAVDIDPYAVATARQNAAANGLDCERYRAVQGDLLDPLFAKTLTGPFQLIVANIVADVIVALCPLFAERLSEHGVLVVSGVIDIKEEMVARAITAAGLHVKRNASMRGWSCLTARRQ